MRIAKLRGSPEVAEELELVVEAMREKAAKDAISRGKIGGENARNDVRATKLAKGWVGADEDRVLAEEAMCKKRADGHASGGAAPRSTLKATGCMITVTEVNEKGELLSEPHVLKASRDKAKARFRIDASAKGGVFDESPFRLEIGDKQSGATADTLGNILNLSSFVVKRRDGHRFHCKFTALIAMANVAAAVSGDKALDVVT